MELRFQARNEPIMRETGKAHIISDGNSAVKNENIVLGVWEVGLNAACNFR